MKLIYKNLCIVLIIFMIIVNCALLIINTKVSKSNIEVSEVVEQNEIKEEPVEEIENEVVEEVVEVAKIENSIETPKRAENTSHRSGTRASGGKVLTKSAGVVQGPSGRETYYNLNMNGVVKIMKNQGYNYEYWVREDGVKMFGDYVMCAANFSYYPRGSIVETTLGTALVCDTGCAYGTIDIAVTW